MTDQAEERRTLALNAAGEHVDSGRFAASLERRVAIPTESQEPDRWPDLYRYLDDEMRPALEAMGFSCQRFENPSPIGGPFLFAERIEDPALPTVLSYGHCDVVRGIPEQWREGLDPWKMTIDGERWYGRGTADNKSQHSIVLAAWEMIIKTRGELGFNAKILLETSEEIASPGLAEFCLSESELLAADVFIASDGPRLKPGRADLKLGNRGSVAFDLKIDLREGSRHSGHWGGVLEDPGIILSHAIASIVDRNGKILVRDWVPDAIPERVKDMIAKCKLDPGEDFPHIDLNWGEPGLTTEEKMYGWTSFIVLSFLTGRPENPVNGVQPDAIARCQIRYSADTDGEVFIPALRRHLDENGFPEVQIIPADKSAFIAWRTDPDDPWVGWAAKSIENTVGYEPTIVPNGAGGLPSDCFGLALHIPILWIPHSYAGCCQHGPNEHVLAPLMREGLQVMTGLFWDLGDKSTTA